jgi:benzoate/toluate 1,2-dioxygenase alpha subunit
MMIDETLCRQSRKRLNHIVDDRPESGIFQLHPSAFSDEEIFALETEFIFERTWSFLGLTSQLPSNHSFLTTQIGRSPVLVSRDGDGRIRAFLNVCRHKGALLSRKEEGCERVHVCPYHQWSYGSDGRHIGMKDKAAGEYPDAFLQDDHNLLELACFDNYRGLMFGSLSHSVPPLQEFLGDMRSFIDLVIDQNSGAIEFIPGRAPYIFHGNWKFQLDNGLDPYHVTSAHASLLSLRKGQQAVDTQDAGPLTVRNWDWRRYEGGKHHEFILAHGHSAHVSDPTDARNLPVYAIFDQLCEAHGKKRAELMLKGLQLFIFPNFQIATGAAGIFRRFQPMAVDRTSMEVRCMGAVGESVERRAARLRQFEDFFNAAGLATPDDSILYENCQIGARSYSMRHLQAYSRGITGLHNGPNEQAELFGICPRGSWTGPAKGAAEVSMHAPYREWARMLKAGIEGTPTYE